MSSHWFPLIWNLFGGRVASASHQKLGHPLCARGAFPPAPVFAQWRAFPALYTIAYFTLFPACCRLPVARTGRMSQAKIIKAASPKTAGTPGHPPFRPSGPCHWPLLLLISRHEWIHLGASLGIPRTVSTLARYGIPTATIESKSLTTKIPRFLWHDFWQKEKRICLKSFEVDNNYLEVGDMWIGSLHRKEALQMNPPRAITRGHPSCVPNPHSIPRQP